VIGLKLGDKIKFQKALTSSKWQSDWDREESIKFAKKHNIFVSESTNGVFIKSKWKVKKFKKIQEGMICGVRNIDISGFSDYEYGWEFGKKKKVYLVAQNLTGFSRVPEEFIIRD
jgi:hypothetical protein